MSYQTMITDAAHRHGYSARWLLAQMHRENASGDPDAVSSVGAIGPAQIMPANAKAAGIDPRNHWQAYDWAAKTMAGYYRTHRAQGHSPERARMMAESDYVCGVTASRKAGGVCDNPETLAYVKHEE